MKFSFGILAMISATALAAPVTVEVRETSPGRFELRRDGERYFVRGVGGVDHLSRVVSAGGNSIRTWGTDQTERAIDEAAPLGLTVCVGLWIEHSRSGHAFDYGDATAVRAQIERHCRVVDRYKDHPAVLLWGVGNELDMGASNDPRAWDTVEAIASYIRRVDPAHPVMTVITHPSAAAIARIRERCPSVQVLGVNCYGGVARAAQHVREFGWPGAYLVTEWGNDGNWEVPKTAWGAELEPTSSEKSAQRARRYAEIVADTERCLGSYVFFWGQKQETTPTWFNFFLPDGSEEESVGALQQLWSGKPPVAGTPGLAPLRLGGRLARESVRVATAAELTFECELLRGDPAVVRVEWVLMPESTHKGSGGDREHAPEPLPLSAAHREVSVSTLRCRVAAPGKAGAYRMFLYVRGPERTVATANFPFLVE